MLKGHTKIELTNVHTGEKEVVEKHNLITNNLSNIVNFYLKHKGTLTGVGNEFYPLYDKFMGGIILFKEAIEENADKILLPSTGVDSITGYASNVVNTGSDIKKGSRNLTESMVLDNGFKYVWDFGTSQANGVISAISLCNNSGGDANPAGQNLINVTSVIVNSSLCNQYFRYELVHYDFDNDIATCIVTTSSTGVVVKKFSLGVNELHFINSPYVVKSVTELNITSPIELPVGGIWMNGYDGYYYYYYCASSTEHKLARMNTDTLQIDTSFGLKNYNVRIYENSVCVSNGYLYASCNSAIDGKNIIKINLSNAEDITGICDRTYGYPMYAVNGIVYYHDQAIFQDDSFITFSTSTSGIANIYVSDSGKFIYIDQSRNYLYLGYLGNNLCTINNLETPVTKTADKTMKITYTITEE